MIFDPQITYKHYAPIVPLRADLRYLLSHIFSISTSDIFTRSAVKTTFIQWVRFHRLARALMRHCPLAYLVRHTDFLGERFITDRRALIPRPETEEMAHALLKRERASSPRSVLDIGTGCGIIAISMKKEYPEWEVTALDISRRALSLARENSRRLLGEEKIHFIRGDIEHSESLFPNRFDLIVANPPYIAERERPLLPDSVHRFEPSVALFGGPDGLDVIRKIARSIPSLLHPQGRLVMEIGFDQSRSVMALFPYFRKKQVWRDLNGRERFFEGEKILETNQTDDP